ncbi:MAG: VOC family protein [Cucumibacter sp.]
MSALDHIGFAVTNYERSRAFYDAALGALRLKCLTEFEVDGERHAGYGAKRPDFWISSGAKQRGATHVAFTAKSRAEVGAFHSIALANGGRDNGAPGLRPHYHEHYFGAFVFDPDGNNIEAVCHSQE